MKTLTSFLVLLGITTMSGMASAQGNASEIEAAKVPLQNYIQAHETGNQQFILKAFSADAKVVGYLGGKLIAWSVDEYAGKFSGTPASDEGQRKRSFELLSLSGDAAVAVVVLDYPTVKFTDYMSLIKVAGEWKIVNKAFNAQPIAARSN
jgi:hypothetical protein